MATKHKPKRNWGWVGGSSFPYLTDEHFQKIANVLHVSKITKKSRSQLQEAIREYFSNKDFMSETPKPGEVKAALLEIRDKAKALKDCIEQLDAISMQKLALKSVFPTAEIYDLRNGESDIHKVYLAAEEALGRLEKDKGGRQFANLALKCFIRDLFPVYVGLTGKKPGVPYKRTKYDAVYDKKIKQYINPETKEVLDMKTVEKLYDKETILPEGPFLRFADCILGIINCPIPKSTLFSAIKSTIKKTS